MERGHRHETAPRYSPAEDSSHGLESFILHAATMMPTDRRFTADWAKDNERRAAGQRAELQHISDFYARQTQQREERENAEARERFAEGQRKMQEGRK
jgi:hypothetical protein